MVHSTSVRSMVALRLSVQDRQASSASDASTETVHMEKKPTRVPRKVHFNETIEERLYPSIPLELYDSIYWSSEDIESMRAAKTHSAKQCRRMHPQIVASVLTLHQLAFDPTESSDSVSNNDDSTCCTTMDESTAKQILVDSNYRGLERSLTSRISKYRLLVRGLVLALQEHNRDKDPQAVQRLLKLSSQRASAASAVYALRMAEVDEQAARAILHGSC